jgi:hypothetical protein
MRTENLVEIFLPMSYGDGGDIPEAIFTLIRDELVETFGGVTLYSRAPAKGLWSQGETIEADQIIVIEVMVAELDKKWWKDFRLRIETLLRQSELFIRTTKVARL